MPVIILWGEERLSGGGGKNLGLDELNPEQTLV